jgi:hypothetical protein
LRAESIYLDLDGVLNSWQLYQLSQFGVNISYDLWPEEIGWDIVGVYNELTDSEWTPALFWNSVERSDWANAPTSEIFDFLIASSVKLVGQEKVFILTSPTLDPDCAAGKMEWMQKHLPRWLQRQSMIGAPKHIASATNRLLFDDSDDNCDKWAAQGGDFCLVPRPWNRNRAYNTIDFVEDCFEVLNAS